MACLGLGVLVLFLQVDHQHAQGHADLDRGEADAGRFVHRLEHVLDERLQLVVERLDGGGDGLEPRIGRFEDFADSHGLKGKSEGAKWSTGPAETEERSFRARRFLRHQAPERRHECQLQRRSRQLENAASGRRWSTRIAEAAMDNDRRRSA